MLSELVNLLDNPFRELQGTHEKGGESREHCIVNLEPTNLA